MSDLQHAVTSGFRKQFRENPKLIVRAPGRVNLIGEHTDYNDGFVLPMAIDRSIYIALRPRTDEKVRLYSLDFRTWGEFDLDKLEKEKGWLEYPKGMAWALQEEGYNLSGWEGVISGNIPRGSGLSSSAALELAIARAFYEVSNFDWNAKKMALLGQRCENDWVGAKTGIMDQLISAAGKKGYALKIDCRSLALKPVALPPETLIVILDTMTRHSHTDSGYNDRRHECERAAAFFNVSSLRELELETLKKAKSTLDPLFYKRAHHVLSENQRTRQAAQAMKEQDANTLGKLMNESHDSLRDDFEVTNDALNQMVNCARAQADCYGARMTGGGFGGSAIALVKKSSAEAFRRATLQCYKEKSGKVADSYICQASQGAQTVLSSS